MPPRSIRNALLAALLLAAWCLPELAKAQPESWEKLNKEGEEYYYNSEYQKAKDCFIRGMALAEKTFGKNHASYATACDNLAFINSMMGSYETAEKLFLESKSIRGRVIGNSHPDYATTCVNLADVYNALGRYDEAEKLYLEASEVFKKNPGEASMEFALVTNNLAGLYFVRGDYRKTEVMYLKAQEIWVELSGKESVDYATACNNLGIVCQQMGDFDRAESYYREAMAITEKVKGKNDPNYATDCNNLGDLYREREEFSKAAPLYLEGLAIRGQVLGEKHPMYAQSCMNVGLLYQDVGQYARAEQYMLKGRQVYLAALGNENVEYGNGCNLMGGLYRKLGNNVKAEEFYLEGLRVFAKALGEEHSDYAQACNDLAGFYRSQRQFDKSETYYLNALRIRRNIYGTDHPSYGATCNNLGLLYYDMGQYERARPLYEESLRIILLRNSKDDAAYGRNVNNMAQLYAMMGKPAEAEPLMLEARSNYEKSLGKDNPDYAAACNNLANFYTTMRRYDKAEPVYNEVKTYQLKQIQLNFKSLSENERQLYYQSIKSTINGYGAFAIHYYPQKPSISGDLYDLQLITKGLIFRSSLKTRQRVLESKDTALINKLEQSLAIRNYLAKVYRMSTADREKKNINVKRLEERANDADKEVNTRASALGIADLAEEQEVTWRDVQARLGKKDAAIEVIRVQTSKDTLYAALIVKAGTKDNPELVMLNAPRVLEGKAMNFYRNSILNQVEDRSSYDAFWKPLAGSLKGVRRIYFSADGVYHQINLSTLINPVTGRYLGDELTINAVGSTRDIATTAHANSSGKVGLFGFPSYGGKASAASEERSFTSAIQAGEWSRYLDSRTGAIPVLPGTREEVESIHGLLGRSHVADEVFVGNDASEVRIKMMRDPRLLHIATHGFFLAAGSGSASNRAAVSGNPLLRSGLLLADCEPAIRGYRIPDGAEDGILTAYEAMNLFLDGTDLVVLSACETGLGEIQNGEGVYGLQRSFLQAGAHAVMISLWKVDDAATRLLMTSFYEEYLRSGDKTRALDYARKTVRARYPQPYYWGAFVLMRAF